MTLSSAICSLEIEEGEQLLEGTPLDIEHLSSLLPEGAMMQCPAGGVYTNIKAGAQVACTVHGQLADLTRLVGGVSESDARMAFETIHWSTNTVALIRGGHGQSAVWLEIIKTGYFVAVTRPERSPAAVTDEVEELRGGRRFIALTGTTANVWMEVMALTGLSQAERAALTPWELSTGGQGIVSPKGE